MNPPNKICDPDRLRLLLSDELSPDLQTEVAEHVAHCEACQRKLEAMAGDQHWWTEVESCFRANRELPDDQTIVPHSGGESMADDSFAADFVVDFLEPCDQPDTLGRLGDYEILDIIGRGGMGIVLRGYHRELGRYVAVKIMAPHLAASGAARQRFIREARAAAAIVHPHVMPIHTVCTTSRLPYLVMPYVACESLQQRIDRQGALDVTEVLRIGMQTAQALAASHAQGLVHRDVKPANILLEKGVDRVMLTDFGLARAADDASLTRTGIVAGTPQYMSPEQARGEPMDARSDLFSLGSVLYAMSAGHPPFRAETMLAVLRRITDTQPRSLREINPAIPVWLEQIVARLHDKTPVQRYASASDVATLLEQCLAHVQQPTAVALPASLSAIELSLAKKPVTSRCPWIIGSVAVLLLAMGIVVATQPWTSTKQNVPPVNPVSESLTNRAVNEQISQMRDELDELEARAERAWDSKPYSNYQHSTQPPLPKDE